MKKIIVLVAILLLTVAVSSISAQGKVVNVSSQPQWGPTGYDYVNYYYLPEIETYYNVPSRKFIYNSGGQWIHSSTLPPAHSAYNLKSGRKVVINEANAYKQHKAHKVKYAKYKSNKGPTNIRTAGNQAKGHHVGNGHEKAKGKGHSKGKH